MYKSITTDLFYCCSQYFDIVVVNNEFIRKNKFWRSSLINNTLQEELKEIYVFGSKCYAEEELSERVIKYDFKK